MITGSGVKEAEAGEGNLVKNGYGRDIIVDGFTDDSKKGVTMGDPDGPYTFIDTLGREVPTYIEAREDLCAPGAARRFQRLNYHVPFGVRGHFKPSDWPDEFLVKISGVDGNGKAVINVRLDDEGYVLCHAKNKGREGQKDGEGRKNGSGKLIIKGAPCEKRAWNRTMYCNIHGGGLHPADRKMSKKSVAIAPANRVSMMTRAQQFMQGFLKPEDLDDEEIQGSFIRNPDGTVVKARALGLTFEQIIAKELHVRLNGYLRKKSMSMLTVMVDIAENELYEPADRIKAAQWVAERTMGKVPEVIVHGTTEAPFESILAGIESGSREDYRKSITVGSERGGIQNPIDVGFVDETGNEVRPGEEDSFVECETCGCEKSECECEEDEGDANGHEINLGDYGRSGQEDDAGDDAREIGKAVPDSDLASNVNVIVESEDISGRTSGEVIESGEGGENILRAVALAEAEEELRQLKIQRIKAIKKAKAKRIATVKTGAAAKAVTHAEPWLVIFEPNKEGYLMQLVPPGEQGPELVQRALAGYAAIAEERAILAQEASVENESESGTDQEEHHGESHG